MGARKPESISRIAKIWHLEKKRPKQDRQNLGARKPKGLSRIAKIRGFKQDSQNLGARKPKSLNRIDKIWEQENQRV